MPTLLHPLLQLLQHAKVEAASGALVREGGVGEAVAQHRAALLQRRPDASQQMIAACGEDQQRLAQRVHRLMQHQFAQPLGQLAATRFTRQQYRLTTRAQPVLQCGNVRGLAGAVDALESDEASARQGPVFF